MFPSPPEATKLSREKEKIRNIVIYSSNPRLIERRDRLARYGVGLLNLLARVWRSDGP